VGGVMPQTNHANAQVILTMPAGEEMDVL